VNVFAGVDPGSRGFITLIDEESTILRPPIQIPLAPTDVERVLNTIVGDFREIRAFLERPFYHGYHPVSQQKLWCSYGILAMGLAMFKVPTIAKDANKWKPAVGAKGKDKKELQVMASTRWPETKFNQESPASAFQAEYCRLQYARFVKKNS
jgi:hypothetical protein